MALLTQSSHEYLFVTGLFILLGRKTGPSHSCIPLAMSNQPLKMSIYSPGAADFILCLHSQNLSYPLVRVHSTHSYFRIIDSSAYMLMVT